MFVGHDDHVSRKALGIFALLDPLLEFIEERGVDTVGSRLDLVCNDDISKVGGSGRLKERVSNEKETGKVEKGLTHPIVF